MINYAYARVVKLMLVCTNCFVCLKSTATCLQLSLTRVVKSRARSKNQTQLIPLLSVFKSLK